MVGEILVTMDFCRVSEALKWAQAVLPFDRRRHSPRYPGLVACQGIRSQDRQACFLGTFVSEAMTNFLETSIRTLSIVERQEPPGPSPR